MKLVVFLGVLVAAGIWIYSSNQAPVVLGPQTGNQTIHGMANADKVASSHNHETAQAVKPPQEASHAENKEANKTVSHFDQLSPEIKQAVKDKLLHSEPLDITKDNKGRTVLKHNRRFTQMPVAVKNADGSVTIKEYSHIPDSK